MSPKTFDIKRPLGRPSTGGTPPAERMRRCVARLQANGGRRIHFAANAQAIADIAAIRARDELQTDTLAIRAALYWFAKVLA